jgi:Amt family ammonium transporter
MAFTEGNAFIGGFDRLFLKGTFDTGDGHFSMAATFSKGVSIPELVFAAFQATFAAITCTPDRRLICRAHQVLRRADLLRASGSPSATCRSPTWSGSGWALTPTPAAEVVDAMNAKAGLFWQWARWTSPAAPWCTSTPLWLVWSVRYVIGKRVGYGKEAMAPHSLTLTMVGAALLWVGWFGFNAGSAPGSQRLCRPGLRQHLAGHCRRRASHGASAKP